MTTGMIILWAISLFLFLGVPIIIMVKAESIYNLVFKFWQKIVDDETKVMIEENKDKFVIFIKVMGGFLLFYMGLRVIYAIA